MLTRNPLVDDPSHESPLPMTESDLLGMDGVQVPDKSLGASHREPKSGRLLAFKLGTIAITVCVLVWLANLVLFGSFLFEGWQQGKITSEIEETRDSILKLPDLAQAQVRLTEAEWALEAEQRAFSTVANSPRVTQGLLDLAESVGIEILEVATDPGETEEVGQHDYRALLVGLQAAGSAEGLVAFLWELENGAVLGGRVDEVSIEEITPSAENASEGDTAGAGRNWSRQTLVASINLTVFERQGNWD